MALVVGLYPAQLSGFTECVIYWLGIHMTTREMKQWIRGHEPTHPFTHCTVLKLSVWSGLLKAQGRTHSETILCEKGVPFSRMQHIF